MKKTTTVAAKMKMMARTMHPQSPHTEFPDTLSRRFSAIGQIVQRAKDARSDISVPRFHWYMSKVCRQRRSEGQTRGRTGDRAPRGSLPAGCPPFHLLVVSDALVAFFVGALVVRLVDQH